MSGGFVTDGAFGERQEARGSCSSPSSYNKRSVDDAAFLALRPKKLTVEERKMRHRISNRKSAKESRQRLNQEFARLSASIETLTTHNLSLRNVNSEWRSYIYNLTQQLELAIVTVLQRQHPRKAAMGQQEIAPRTCMLDRPNNMPGATNPPPGHHYCFPRPMMEGNLPSEADNSTNEELLSTANLSEMLAVDRVILADPMEAPAPRRCYTDASRQWTTTMAATSAISNDDDRIIAATPNAEEEKKMRRMMANRKSAKQSRERRNQDIANLAAEIDILTAANRALRKHNAEMTDDVRDMKNQLVAILGVVQQRQKCMT